MFLHALCLPLARRRRRYPVARSPVALATRASARPRHRLTSRPWTLTAVVCVLSAAFTALVLLLRPFDVAYRSLVMHVAAETIAVVIGTTAAYLFFGRYRLNGRVSDLVLAASLLVLAIGSLFFLLLPALLSWIDDFGGFSTWAQVMSGLLGAIGFAVAAYSERELRLSRRSAILVAFGLAGLLLVIGTVTRVLSAHLPLVVSPTLSPVEGGREVVIGQPLALVAQLLTMVCFALAAAGFLRRAARSDDRLLGTLAAASAVGAFAALNYFVFPSLYSQWIYSGDILAFVFYVLILAGVAGELNGYWRDLARVAVLEERRRIARELHDGLAQELAFIASQSRLLGSGGVEQRLSSAADRALEESRRAIDALTKPLGEPVEVVVARAAEEVATRVGARLTLDLQPGIETTPAAREALRRIVREATVNATEHGQATHVRISLERNGAGLHLAIADDGSGFDPARPTEGFGLISIHERAAMLGGEARIDSRPGAGTTVEVFLR
jgi:signal transduction histidine kinase